MSESSRPVIPGSRFAERLARARNAARTAGLDALLIGVGSDLRYLTGYEAMPLERLTMLVIRPEGEPSIVIPRLERGAAEAGLQTELTIRTWDETDDPYAMGRPALTVAGWPSPTRCSRCTCFGSRRRSDRRRGSSWRPSCCVTSG